MRSDIMRAAFSTVAVGLLLLAAACSGGGAAHTAAPPHRAASAAKAIPSPVAMRGPITTRAANAAYESVIAPGYPLAVQAAEALALHPAAAAPAVSAFTSRLAKSLASIAAVTAFPAGSEQSFAAYRSSARAALVMLEQPASVAVSEQSRRRAALQLYALAHEIGVLGISLHLVPATEQGGKH